MAMGATVYVKQRVELSAEQVEQIARGWLGALKEGHWIEKSTHSADRGKLMTEHVTSHRYDACVGGREHPLYDLVAAVERLQAVLEKRHAAAGRGV